MNVAWRIESGREGVMQVGAGKVVLTNMAFKENCHSCEKMGINHTHVLRRINQRKKEETRNF